MSAHIERYHLLVKVLYKAIQGKARARFKLDEEQVEAFNKLKLAVDKAPNLHLFVLFERVFMAVDASQTGCAALIFQYIDGKKHILRFWSHRWNPALSKRHHSTSLECMALCLCSSSQSYYSQSALDVIFLSDCFSIIRTINKASSSLDSLYSRYAMRLSGLIACFRLQWHSNKSDLAQIPDILSREEFFNDESFINSDPDPARKNFKVPDEWYGEKGQNLTYADLHAFAITQVFPYEGKYIDEEEKLPSVWDEQNVDEIVASVTKHSDDEALLYSEDEKDELLFGDNVYDRVIEMQRDTVNGRKSKLEIGAISVNSEPSQVPTESMLFASKISSMVHSLAESTISSLHLRKDMLKPMHNNLFNIHVVTPEQIARGQRADEEYNRIIQMFLTQKEKDIPEPILRHYLLLHNFLLVRRADISKPFEEPGNLKIVLGDSESVLISCMAHLLGHIGLRRTRLRVSTFYYVRRLDLITATLINSCKVCQMSTLHLNNQVEAGITTKEYEPLITWHMDLVSLPKSTYKGRAVHGFLNIHDLGSRFCYASMIGVQSVNEVMEILKETFYKHGMPQFLASDSGSQLLGSPVIRSFLHQAGVTTVRQINYNVHSHGTIEKENQSLRRLLMCNESSMKQKWPQVFSASCFQLNSAPRKFKIYEEKTKQFQAMFISPMEVVYGKGNIGFEKFLTRHYTAQERSIYQTVLKKILQRSVEMQRKQQEQKDQDLKIRRPTKFHIGQIVLYRAFPYDKKKFTYRNNLFTIIAIKNRKVILSPIYGPRRHLMGHIKNIKRITSDPAMVAKLPLALQKYFVVIKGDLQDSSQAPSWLENYTPPPRVRPPTRAKPKENPEKKNDPTSVSSAQPSAFGDDGSDGLESKHVSISILSPDLYYPDHADAKVSATVNTEPVKQPIRIKITPAELADDVIKVNKHVKHLAVPTVVISSNQTPLKTPPVEILAKEQSQDIPLKKVRVLSQVLPKFLNKVKDYFTSPLKNLTAKKARKQPKLLSEPKVAVRRGTRPRKQVKRWNP
jgi:hypothetical protein